MYNWMKRWGGEGYYVQDEGVGARLNIIYNRKKG